MPSPDQVGPFMRLFTSHEPRLRAFALSLIPNWADAEDVLQQANLVIWEKFDAFQPGTDFFAWAGRIVFLTAKDFRKRQLRTKVRFDDAFLEAVAAEAIALQGEMDERRRALDDCVQRLPPRHREVLRLRYEQRQSAEETAERVGRTADAIHNLLSRVRKALFDCVTRKVRAEGLA